MRIATAFLTLTLGMITARADILLASRDTHAVLSYNETTGVFIGIFTSGGNLAEPESIAFGPDICLS